MVTPRWCCDVSLPVRQRGGGTRILLLTSALIMETCSHNLVSVGRLALAKTRESRSRTASPRSSLRTEGTSFRFCGVPGGRRWRGFGRGCRPFCARRRPWCRSRPGARRLAELHQWRRKQQRRAVLSAVVGWSGLRRLLRCARRVSRGQVEVVHQVTQGTVVRL